VSAEQLSALLAKLKSDAGLTEKLKGAADLDAAVAIAKDAGFDVNKADWLKHVSDDTPELKDEELEALAGGLNSAKCIVPSAASCSVVGNAICVDSNTLKGWIPSCD
jgi:predicted ribosomally synthesized peptide with nif11-like leader